MITYTRRNVLMISLVISIVIFCIFGFLTDKIITIKSIDSEKNNTEIVLDAEAKEKTNIDNMDNKIMWQLEIPKINLIAPISEGIDGDTLNKYVGHFPTTSIDNGNIGLAGHNRGYNKNYFENLKNLVVGDEIIYKKDGIIRRYKVAVITVIEDTNWSYLEKTLDNRITLITCVENEPSKRRCIQGIETAQEI